MERDLPGGIFICQNPEIWRLAYKILSGIFDIFGIFLAYFNFSEILLSKEYSKEKLST